MGDGRHRRAASGLTLFGRQAPERHEESPPAPRPRTARSRPGSRSVRPAVRPRRADGEAQPHGRGVEADGQSRDPPWRTTSPMYATPTMKTAIMPRLPSDARECSSHGLGHHGGRTPTTARRAACRPPAIRLRLAQVRQETDGHRGKDGRQPCETGEQADDGQTPSGWRHRAKRWGTTMPETTSP